MSLASARYRSRFCNRSLQTCYNARQKLKTAKSELVTFAVLNRGIALAKARLFLFSGLLLSGFLWSSFLLALLLFLGIVAFKYVSTHCEFSFLLSLYLGQDPKT